MNIKTFKKLLKTEKWRFTIVKEGWGDMEVMSWVSPEDAVSVVEQKVASMFDPNISNHNVFVVFTSSKKKYKLKELESFIPVLESLGKDEDVKDLKEIIEKLKVASKG